MLAAADAEAVLNDVREKILGEQPHNGFVASDRDGEGERVAEDFDGIPVPGAPGWYELQTEEGETYYFNYDTNTSSWELPVEAVSDDQMEPEEPE